MKYRKSFTKEKKEIKKLILSEKKDEALIYILNLLIDDEVKKELRQYRSRILWYKKSRNYKRPEKYVNYWDDEKQVFVKKVGKHTYFYPKDEPFTFNEKVEFLKELLNFKRASLEASLIYFDYFKRLLEEFPENQEVIKEIANKSNSYYFSLLLKKEMIEKNFSIFNEWKEKKIVSKETLLRSLRMT